MPKDSQIDPKKVRVKKSGGMPTLANDEQDGNSLDSKKHSENKNDI